VEIFISLGKELAALGHLFLAGNKYHHPTLIGQTVISQTAQGLSLVCLQPGIDKTDSQSNPGKTIEYRRDTSESIRVWGWFEFQTEKGV
jgi:hypothetical protein